MRILSLTIVALLLSTGLSIAQKLTWKDGRSLKRIKKTIAYLASDQLQGRETGTKGEELSSEYIADQFAKLGLEPKGEKGYFQEFSITTLRIANANSAVTLIGEPQKLFVDYYPLSYSCNNSDVTADVIDVGFGISNDKRDDYKDLDVKNKIVRINVGSPDGIHPHSAWVAWHGINIRVDEAVKHGAIGVIFYRTDVKTEKPEGELALQMKPSNVPVIFVTRPVQLIGEMAHASLKINILNDGEIGHNVIGFKDNGAKYTVVIGAHHDHLGMGHEGSLSGGAYEIHNGADDNASGVAALIELAKKMRKSKKWNSNYNYLFIAFSGEEKGLIGSKYFVSHPTIELNTINYMINMDMVGMLNPETKTLIINGIGTGSHWKQSIVELDRAKRGIKNVLTTESGVGPSDHTSFYLKQIPAIHFFTGSHAHYHKPTDDIENLNLKGEVFVINYISGIIEKLNASPKQLFTPTLQADSANQLSNRSSLKVTLGIAPSYTYDGEGLMIDAVVAGKPAQIAGLKNGDVIVSLHNEAVRNISDYMKILKGIEPGVSSSVSVRRGGEVLVFEIQF